MSDESNLNLLSLSSSDEDEEDELLRRVEKSTPKGKHVSRTEDHPKRMNKRQRSRSRSVTPPPALAATAVMHARETVA